MFNILKEIKTAIGNITLFDLAWILGAAVLIWLIKWPWFVEIGIAFVICVVFSTLSVIMENGLGRDVTDELNKED